EHMGDPSWITCAPGGAGTGGAGGADASEPGDSIAPHTSTQQRHLVARMPIERLDAEEVDPARHGHAAIIPPVPADEVWPRLCGVVQEGSHESSTHVEDP